MSLRLVFPITYLIIVAANPVPSVIRASSNRCRIAVRQSVNRSIAWEAQGTAPDIRLLRPGSRLHRILLLLLVRLPAGAAILDSEPRATPPTA